MPDESDGGGVDGKIAKHAVVAAELLDEELALLAFRCLTSEAARVGSELELLVRSPIEAEERKSLALRWRGYSFHVV